MLGSVDPCGCSGSSEAHPHRRSHVIRSCWSITYTLEHDADGMLPLQAFWNVRPSSNANAYMHGGRRASCLQAATPRSVNRLGKVLLVRRRRPWRREQLLRLLPERVGGLERCPFFARQSCSRGERPLCKPPEQVPGAGRRAKSLV